MDEGDAREVAKRIGFLSDEDREALERVDPVQLIQDLRAGIEGLRAADRKFAQITGRTASSRVADAIERIIDENIEEASDG